MGKFRASVIAAGHLPACNKRYHTYSVHVGKVGVETMELCCCVVGAKPPVDSDAGDVAPGFVGRDGTLQDIGIGVSTL